MLLLQADVRWSNKFFSLIDFFFILTIIQEFRDTARRIAVVLNKFVEISIIQMNEVRFCVCVKFSKVYFFTTWNSKKIYTDENLVYTFIYISLSFSLFDILNKFFFVYMCVHLIYLPFKKSCAESALLINTDFVDESFKEN